MKDDQQVPGCYSTMVKMKDDQQVPGCANEPDRLPDPSKCCWTHPSNIIRFQTFVFCQQKKIPAVHDPLNMAVALLALHRFKPGGPIQSLESQWREGQSFIGNSPED